MKLKRIVCLICHKEITFFNNSRLDNIDLCKTCYNKLPTIYKKFKIGKIKAMAVYNYSDFIKQLILKLKAKGDLELAKCFLSPIKEHIKNSYSNYTLIPGPSSERQNTQRGYNHVVEIFRVLDLPIAQVLYKKEGYKQSNQTKMLRHQIAKHLIIDKFKIVPKNRYLLVDDIITSGETLKACIELLKSCGVKKIKVLVIAYNCRK